MGSSSKFMSSVMLGGSVLLVLFAAWFLSGVISGGPGWFIVVLSIAVFIGTLIALASSVNVYRRARRGA